MPKPSAEKFVSPADAALSVPSTAKVTPSCIDFSRLSSPMKASSFTCARRMSSLSITPRMLRMILGGAVMTSEFVGGSAQMMALPC